MLPDSIRVALYARCSTIEQHPEMQMAELREYALRRGWRIAGEYVDAGISGARESRPQLNRLMADAKRRASGVSWRDIATQLGVSLGTAYRRAA